MSNIYGIADDILIAGIDDCGKDHYEILEKVFWVSQQVNLKLNKDKCLFRYTSIAFFSEIIPWQGVSSDQWKLSTSKHATTKD